jgi:hypothetical protein
MNVELPSGIATGVGSLPHRDARVAAEFVLTVTPDLPAVPSLPRRSPAEGMIAQAVVGIPGISLGQYGAIGVDVASIDRTAPVTTDLDHDAFGGMRAFVAAAKGRRAPIKWQSVGPVTLGLALQRAGLPQELAFDVAARAVRDRVRAIHLFLADELPGCPQVLMIDEPSLPEVHQRDAPLAPDTAIDLVSGALAPLESSVMTGVHCCGAADWASVLAAGPAILSMPVSADVVNVAGYLARFLDDGGWIMWGAVPTDSIVPTSAERPWRELSDVWCQLVGAGCDAIRLRRQALVSPACGLGLHSAGVANQAFKVVRELSHRVHSQAVATRLTIGA